MTRQKHVCSGCRQSFDAKPIHAQETSWKSIFYNREPSVLDDFKKFDLVTCPHCGKTEHASEIKLLGIFYRRRVPVLIGIVILMYSAFIVRVRKDG